MVAREFGNERHTGRNLTGALIAGVFLTALTVGVDKVAENNQRRQRNKKARIISYDSEGDRPVYVMVGCRADGEYIGDMLAPHIKHVGPIRAEAYSDDDFDLEDLKQKELESRSRDLGRAAVVYCSSMGGMKFTKSLADKEYREKFGKIDTLILDSSPADISDLDKETRLAMFAAKVLPRSWMISRLYRGFMRRSANKLRGHSSKITDEQVRGHLLSTADTPLEAVRSQAEFIRGAHLSELADGELAGVADRIIYVSSAHDHVVNTDSAYKEYNRIFGGNVIKIVDLMRDEFGHADGPEQPELIAELMEGRLPQSESLPLPEAEPAPLLGRPVAA